MREESEIIGYHVSQRRVSSSLQEEGDDGIMTMKGSSVKRSPAILQREEMRGRDGNQRREGRDRRHYPLYLSPLLCLGGGRRWHYDLYWKHNGEESSHPTERGDERKGWQSEEGGEGRRKRLKGEGGEWNLTTFCSFTFRYPEPLWRRDLISSHFLAEARSRREAWDMALALVLLVWEKKKNEMCLPENLCVVFEQ
jgi:hypothetical protein